MTVETLNKMDACRHLLPEPGGEVVGELITELRKANTLLEDAWGVIANAGVSLGDWESMTPDWRAAAARWRDEWHLTLQTVKDETSKPRQCGSLANTIGAKPMNQAEEIIADKELRRDIDAIIQRVKACPSTRERSITITKLQEGVMWLGMDLKRINEANPAQSVPPKSVRQCAEEAYARYGSITDFKNFRGDPMPAFAELGEKIQTAWEAAVSVPQYAGNPYPNSKDPSNLKIEPTADNLKL